jgi:phosphate starvation-inducible protein PhoH and related proteins
LNELNEIKVDFPTNDEAAVIFGKYDENLRLIEKFFETQIISRGNEIIIKGVMENIQKAEALFNQLKGFQRGGCEINEQAINYASQMVKNGVYFNLADLATETVISTIKGKPIKPKTFGQKVYLKAIEKNDIVFGVGPAGTGKTYLAVVMAVLALKNKAVEKIVLTRPAVEAGEKLGFLPGDLQEKVDPYLRPLYDGLYSILGAETTQKYIERSIIEIAPLAYMRGRTLENSFIILDEAQNTTPEQMKMFLTRIGMGSQAIITGDVTQIDLPRGQSGLVDATKRLTGIEGIYLHFFNESDVVRHSLVQKIIQAYAREEE